MKILEFVKKYDAMPTQQMKDNFIKNNLKIKSYVPFLNKDTIINNLLKITMTDRETGNVKVNSSAEYLLLTRIFIEQYTNLTVETEGFFEEYDELKKSGLFNILLVGNDTTAPLIPYEEIVEFKHILNIKKADYMTNHFTPQAFISNQIERIKQLGKVLFAPFIEALSKKIDEIPKEELDKIVEFAKKGNSKEM